MGGLSVWCPPTGIYPGRWAPCKADTDVLYTFVSKDNFELPALVEELPVKSKGRRAGADLVEDAGLKRASGISAWAWVTDKDDLRLSSAEPISPTSTLPLRVQI